jgi:hypothetical protein
MGVIIPWLLHCSQAPSSQRPSPQGHKQAPGLPSGLTHHVWQGNELQHHSRR